MMGILNRFSVIALVVVVATASVAFGQASVEVSPEGQLVVNSDGGAVGIFVGGPDITDLCVEPYCNNNANTGTDGQQYNVLLGYSDGAGQNQWLFFNLSSTEGVDVVDGVFADAAGCPLCNERIQSLVGMPWSIDYGPSLNLPPAEGMVTLVPEPATGLLSLLGLALFGYIRRR